MNREKALHILKITAFSSKEDIEIQFQSQKDWNLKAIQNSNSDIQKEVYQNKLRELEEAHKFLMEQSESKKKSLDLPKVNVKLKRSHRVILVATIISSLGLVLFLFFRSQRADEYLKSGLKEFDEYRSSQDFSRIKSAKSLFEKSMNWGSNEGEFYYGLMLYKEGELEEGVSIMFSAEQNGFSDTTNGDFIFYLGKKDIYIK